MSSVVMIIRNELGQQPPEMALVRGDDTVEQLAPATAHPALRNSVLPRASEGGLDRTREAHPGSRSSPHEGQFVELRFVPL
jgi:hypothetical protein